MKIRIAILLFLLIGAFFIISENNLSLNKSENLTKFMSLYSSWMYRIFDNMGNSVGYVVKMEWLPQEEG